MRREPVQREPVYGATERRETERPRALTTGHELRRTSANTADATIAGVQNDGAVRGGARTRLDVRPRTEQNGRDENQSDDNRSENEPCTLIAARREAEALRASEGERPQGGGATSQRVHKAERPRAAEALRASEAGRVL